MPVRQAGRGLDVTLSICEPGFQFHPLVENGKDHDAIMFFPVIDRKWKRRSKSTLRRVSFFRISKSAFEFVQGHRMLLVHLIRLQTLIQNTFVMLRNRIERIHRIPDLFDEMPFFAIRKTEDLVFDGFGQHGVLEEWVDA